MCSSRRQITLLLALRHRPDVVVDLRVEVPQPALRIRVARRQSSNITILLLTARMQTRRRLNIRVRYAHARPATSKVTPRIRRLLSWQPQVPLQHKPIQPLRRLRNIRVSVVRRCAAAVRDGRHGARGRKLGLLRWCGGAGDGLRAHHGSFLAMGF